MRLAKSIFYFLLSTSCFFIITIIGSGCAQIGAPTGGTKDTIPPTLVKENPEFKTTNFSGNKISFSFDEYVEVKDIQNNLLVSPYPKINPIVEYKLKTVTVKLKDTLQPNTTYSINFGNAIQDVNENNPLKNFTYIFSTGNVIDSFELHGNIILAETGKTDSTIWALLYRDAVDSTVANRKPDYIAKADGKGEFSFYNLPAGNFKVYALKDGDGGKTYNSPVETFGFLDSSIIIGATNKPVTLYAYAEEIDERKPGGSPSKQNAQQEKKFKYSTTLSNGQQDLLTPLEINFTHPLKDFIEQKILLTDTSFQEIPGTKITIDSNQKKVTLATTWKYNEPYRLILDKDGLTDTSGNQLTKTDTVRFVTKKEADYGSLLLHFKGAEIALHPVLQFVQNNIVIRSTPITGAAWSDKLFLPGEYELRILYDSNQNGQWDPGNYLKKIQPEKVITLDKKLSIRANWDNERDIAL